MINPPYEIGKNVTFSISQVTEATDGTLTVGTASAFTGRAKRAHVHNRRINDETHALDAGIENNIPILQSWTVSLSEVRRRSGVGSNYGEEAFNAGPLAQIVITTALHVYTYIGVLGDFDLPIEAGGIIQEINLVPIDTGATPNPTIV